eukprot:972022-Amphidinium_carterae.1
MGVVSTKGDSLCKGRSLCKRGRGRVYIETNPFAYLVLKNNHSIYKWGGPVSRSTFNLGLVSPKALVSTMVTRQDFCLFKRMSHCKGGFSVQKGSVHVWDVSLSRGLLYTS